MHLLNEGILFGVSFSNRFFFALNFQKRLRINFLSLEPIPSNFVEVCSWTPESKSNPRSLYHILWPQVVSPSRSFSSNAAMFGGININGKHFDIKMHSIFFKYVGFPLWSKTFRKIFTSRRLSYIISGYKIPNEHNSEKFRSLWYSIIQIIPTLNNSFQHPWIWVGASEWQGVYGA